MAYFNIYRIPFVSREGVAYSIDLYRDGEQPESVITLDGATSPFITTLECSDPYFDTQRITTARISFVDDISLDMLAPTSAKEWRVLLVRETDNAVLYTGYLTAEVYSQPYIAPPNIVTINARSPLSMATDTPMATDKGSLTVGELLGKILDESLAMSRVYFPAMYYLDTQASGNARYTLPLLLRFATSNFIEPTNGSSSGEEWKSETYGAALSAISIYLGWTALDRGDGALWLISAGWTGAYLYAERAQLDAEDFFEPAGVVWGNARPAANIEAVNSSDTISIHQGVRSVTINDAAKEVTLGVPSIEESFESVLSADRDYRTVFDASGTRQESLIVRSLYISTSHIGGRATLVQHHLTKPTPESEEVWEQASTTGVLGVDMGGAVLNYYDWYARSLNGVEEPPKAGWSLSTAIVLREWVAKSYNVSGGSQTIVSVMPQGLPLVQLKGRVPILAGGAIVIDFEIMALQNKGVWIPEDGVWTTALSSAGNFDVSSYNAIIMTGYPEFPDLTSLPRVLQANCWGTDDDPTKVSCSLKVGSMWWNGTAWVNSFSLFDIPISAESGQWHAIATNKTVDEPYEGDRGWYIPAPPVSEDGSLSLVIYSGITRKNASGVAESVAVDFYMRGVEVRYASPIDSFFSSLNKGAEFYRNLGNSFEKEVAISLPLHSKINSSILASLLFLSDGTPIDKVAKEGSSNVQKIEEHLLDSYEARLSEAYRTLSRSMPLFDFTPIDYFTESGKAQAIVGYTIDFDDDTINTTLAECDLT